MAGTNQDLFGHPKGLYILFFTELWERYSYYGMRAILVLYMVSKIGENNPGLGWDETTALSIYGWYTMAVYLASVPGGIIADRFLGQKKMVMIGGIFLCLGHSVLAVNETWAFFLGLCLIVLGCGALKPNISTMVGGLYEQNDHRRDAGFTIFYIGINLGAFLAALSVGYVGEAHGWHYGFGLAGTGMLLGQAVYLWGQKHLKDVGNLQGHAGACSESVKSQPLTKIEKDRVIVLLLSFLIVIVFWGAFEQAGGLMNLYTKEKIDRSLFGVEVPASVFQALNPLFIMVFGSVVAAFWASRKKQGKESSSLFKMAIGTIIMGSGFLLMSFAALETESAMFGKAALYWLIGAYFLHTIGELCASPVALSFITKLAPAKYASLMMGVFFAFTGLGSKIAGVVGELAQDAGELKIFTGIFGFCVAFGLLLLIFLKRLNALTHGAENLPQEMFKKKCLQENFEQSAQSQVSS